MTPARQREYELRQHKKAERKARNLCGYSTGCPNTNAPGRTRCQPHLDSERAKEGTARDSDFQVYCSICRGPGHNQRGCPQRVGP